MYFDTYKNKKKSNKKVCGRKVLLYGLSVLELKDDSADFFYDDAMKGRLHLFTDLLCFPEYRTWKEMEYFQKNYR